MNLSSPPNEGRYLEKTASTRSALLEQLLTASTVISVPILGIVLYSGFHEGHSAIILIQGIALCTIVLLSRVTHSISLQHRAVAVLGLFSLAAVSDVFRAGLESPTFVFLAVIPVMVSAIEGIRTALAMLVACVAVLMAAAWFTIDNEAVLQAGITGYRFKRIPLGRSDFQCGGRLRSRNPCRRFAPSPLPGCYYHAERA
ncbi:hypothetical protein ACUNV4_23805 [Granulosicoccus sp. 3-233]|uniref:hypothetical protein n=1 Tax=Granulosicoccus sp. 3-233 TaxID=3417969 RepID=UPI003D34BAE7